MRSGKLLSLLLFVTIVFTLASCGGESPSMYIENAQLTEEEKAIAELLNMQQHLRIFDFVVDHNAKRMRINTYELLNGEWSPISIDYHEPLNNTDGRLAFEFDHLDEGMRFAIQSGGNTGSASYSTQPEYDTLGMGYGTSTMSGRTEIIYGVEMPVAIQIVTSKSSFQSCSVNYFSTPEELAKYGYEHIYAITVCFEDTASTGGM